ncbi:hypothetical protein ACBJ59_61345 [Nonomuraea sp. MTCD27]
MPNLGVPELLMILAVFVVGLLLVGALIVAIVMGVRSSRRR